MIISVSGNIAPARHIPSAVHDLRSALEVTAVSPFYRTPPIDRPEQEHYWNGVVAAEDGMARDLVLDILRRIEHAHGRIRKDDRFAARTLDLDLVEWKGEWDDDVRKRAFLRRAIADIGLLPPKVAVPAATWPVAWKP